MRIIRIVLMLLVLTSWTGVLLVSAEVGGDNGPSIEDMDPEFIELFELQEKADRKEITPEEETRRFRLLGRLSERMDQVRRANHVLEGEVVDEDGNQLSDVSLTISKNISRGWDRWDRSVEEERIDGAFSIGERGYTRVDLYFSKDGYYDERLSFSAPLPGGDEALRRESPRPGVVEDRNIRVMLEKKGDITQLLPYRGPLEFLAPYDRETLGAVVIDFSKSPVPYRQRPLTRIEDINDYEALPPGSLYIVADTDDEGRIAVVQYPRPEWPERPYRWPQRVRIIINDPDGGFVMHEREDSQPASWRMKRAPEDGYVQELVLDADALHSIRGINANVYFYFKTGGRYGKGQIGSVSLHDGDTRLTTGGSYNLQPDGTRNVDTGRR